MNNLLITKENKKTKRFILDFQRFNITVCKNKHLTEYLRNSGNELATVLFSAFCGAILSNNSFICKVITFY